MKYILIATILLLGCADNITNTNYTKEPITYCSVDKHSSGEPKDVYTIGTSVEKLHDTPNYYTVVVDSVHGDSTFVSTEDGKKVIIDQQYKTIDRICSINRWYDYDMADYGYAELYYSCDYIERCEIN